MFLGFPPAAAAANLSARGAVAGPSEGLSLGEAGLISLPAVGSALTFQPPADGSDPGAWRHAWERWVAGEFAPVLAPALVHMANLAVCERVRELQAADLALADRLAPGEQSSRLREAGRRVLADLRGARSARWLDRFQAWAAEGQTPALFPTVFAARAALFHLPLRPMLAGYALVEWRAASGGGGATATVPPSDALAALPAGVLRPTVAAV